MDLIDPPVGRYSDPGEIRAWISELKKLEQTEEVKLAIEEAEAWLKGNNKK